MYNLDDLNTENNNFETILHPRNKKYWELGAYFGHSVVGFDLNRDSFDDLIVSAPLFADGKTSYDQGRVFVFWNNPNVPGMKGWVSIWNIYAVNYTVWLTIFNHKTMQSSSLIEALRAIIQKTTVLILI